MRHLKPKRQRKWLKVTGITLASALVLGGAGAGYLYWDMNQRLKSNSVDIGADPSPLPTMTAIPEAKPQIASFQGAFTVLLLGNDSGQGSAQYGSRDHGLSDVNILLHVSADHTKATAVSIPRDMFVDVPECVDPQTEAVFPAVNGIKINEALERGGMKCSVDTVRQLTGQSVQYAAMIQFQGVVALSNVVGGVPVCLTTAINDPMSGLNLPAGTTSISGDQALAFLRTRHGVGDGSDLARISNQQTFLSSLMRKLKSADTLSDPTKVLGIANAVADNMTLSSNLASVNTLASLAVSLKDISLSDITFIQYPTAYGTVNGEEGVVPDTASAAQMLDAVFSDKAVKLTGGTAPGSIGAVTEPNPTTSAAPSASPSTTPSTGSEGAPAATASPSPTDTATPEPSTSPSATSVALPQDVTGMTAAQNTCSRGYGDY